MLKGRVHEPLGLAFAVVLVAFSAQGIHAGSSEEGTVSEYFCPKYDAVLQFSENGTMKAFGAEFPTFDPGSSDAVANTATKLKSCSADKRMLCLEEVLSSDVPRYGIVYAIPRSVSAGETYRMGGWDFTTFQPLTLHNAASTVLTVATLRKDGKVISRYKMYVESGVGVRYLYFDRIPAALYGSNRLDREFTSVACVLRSKIGILSGIEVHTPKSP